MRLINLNPNWVSSGGDGVFDANHQPVPKREHIGIRFDCPCGCATPCVVPFSNPLDGLGPVKGIGPTWERTGEEFETLTLTPSIHRVRPCGWHGFITNGEIRPC